MLPTLVGKIVFRCFEEAVLAIINSQKWQIDRSRGGWAYRLQRMTSVVHSDEQATAFEHGSFIERYEQQPCHSRFRKSRRLLPRSPHLSNEAKDFEMLSAKRSNRERHLS